MFHLNKRKSTNTPCPCCTKWLQDQKLNGNVMSQNKCPKQHENGQECVRENLLIYGLPREIMVVIMSYCSGEELIICTQVNKKFREHAQDPFVLAKVKDREVRKKTRWAKYINAERLQPLFWHISGFASRGFRRANLANSKPDGKLYFRKFLQDSQYPEVKGLWEIGNYKYESMKEFFVFIRRHNSYVLRDVNAADEREKYLLEEVMTEHFRESLTKKQTQWAQNILISELEALFYAIGCLGTSLIVPEDPKTWCNNQVIALKCIESIFNTCGSGDQTVDFVWNEIRRCKCIKSVPVATVL